MKTHWLRLLALLILTSLALPSLAEVYVTNYYPEPPGTDSVPTDPSIAGKSASAVAAIPTAPAITVYATDSVGNAAPLRTISGPATGLVYPSGIAVDEVHHELYVADFFGEAIRVFDLSANGNVAPLRTLVNGPNSHIAQPRTVVVDIANDEIIVISFNDGIRSFPRTASGDATPLRTISGAATLLDNPPTVVLDSAHGELIASSGKAGGPGVPGILIFDRNADGNVAPLRIIAGSQTQTGAHIGHIALDPVHDEIIIPGQSGTSILAFPRAGNGDIAPLRQMTDSSVALSNPRFAVDTVNDRLLVANYERHELRAYPRTATGPTAALMALAGPATGLYEPHDLAIDSAGGLSGIGGFAATPVTTVPALTPWSLGALALLLAGLTLIRLRRS